jgi:hypothetical protein
MSGMERKPDRRHDLFDRSARGAASFIANAQRTLQTGLTHVWHAATWPCITREAAAFK